VSSARARARARVFRSCFNVTIIECACSIQISCVHSCHTLQVTSESLRSRSGHKRLGVFSTLLQYAGLSRHLDIVPHSIIMSGPFFVRCCSSISDSQRKMIIRDVFLPSPPLVCTKLRASPPNRRHQHEAVD
jgi:hypothetical protein